MENNHIDLRIIKTKEAIKTALFDLVTETGFETITVKELTIKANINRGTFYRHYENIDDLINEYYEDFIMKLNSLFEQNHLALIDVSDRYYSNNTPCSPFIVNILKFIKENHKLFRTLWSNQANLYYQMKLKNYVKNILFYNENALINKKDLLVPESYYTAYVFSAFMGVLRQWLNGDCHESPEEIAQIISTLNLKGIFTASGL